LIARLDAEKDDATRQVLAIGLLDAGAASGVSTSALAVRAEAGGADAPLAVLELARRADSGAANAAAFLASPDPLLRAHAAAGLGASASRDATGRLAHAYVGEVIVAVRRAIVTALVERGAQDALAPSHVETLEWAANLDPDGTVRIAAKQGLERTRAPSAGSVHEVAWIHLIAAEGATLPTPVTGALVGSDGLARPIAFDEEGYALVAGVPPGPALLRLAPGIQSYKGAQP
jgi:HEAT repeats